MEHNGSESGPVTGRDAAYQYTEYYLKMIRFVIFIPNKFYVTSFIAAEY